MDTTRVLNLHEVTEVMARCNGDTYESRYAPVGTLLGAEKLGYSLTEIPPGNNGFSYHFHRVHQELFLVIEGTGTLRSAERTKPFKPGDLPRITLPRPAGCTAGRRVRGRGDRRRVRLGL